MAIDDPVGVVIQQAHKESEEDSYLPTQLIRLGMSAVAATAFVTWPFISQIMTTLLAASSSRFEERFLRVAEELNAQHKRIQEKIPDEAYYQSEEFQTLLGLLLERLHTTHDRKKLKMFGDALANSGSSEFGGDDKETFIRVLRDLSLKDLETLNHNYLKGWLPLTRDIDYAPDVLSSLSRLVGQGLVLEKLKPNVGPNQTSGSARLDSEQALKSFLTKPPKSTYLLSPLGTRFLVFVSDEASDKAPIPL